MTVAEEKEVNKTTVFDSTFSLVSSLKKYVKLKKYRKRFIYFQYLIICINLASLLEQISNLIDKTKIKSTEILIGKYS